MDHKFIRLLVATAILEMTACGTNNSTAAAAQGMTPVGETRALQNGWVEAHPEPGLLLLTREGWNAHRDEGGVGPIVFSGPDNARVIVWPTFVLKGRPVPPPAALLTTYAARTAGRFEWSAPQQFQTNAHRMYGRSGNYVAQATYVYQDSQIGQVGFWYFAAAKENQYRSLQPLFAQFMKGVRLIGTAPAAGDRVSGAGGRQVAKSPPLTFVSWTDPREHAYTTEVPQGWQVQGGIFRSMDKGIVDAMEITSPDRQLTAFAGDPTLPIFSVPSPQDAAIGLREGMHNGAPILMHYIPAVQFIDQYVRNRFGKSCPNLQITDIADLPEVSGPTNRELMANGARSGVREHVDFAVAQFRCETTEGIVFLATRTSGMSPANTFGASGDIWNVSAVFGATAPASRIDEASSALLKMLSSKQVDQQWARGNQDLMGKIIGITGEAAASMNQVIAKHSSGSTSGGGSKSQSDDLSRQWQNSTMDQTDVVNPNTGEITKVQSGSNYYWMDQNNSVVGTNAPSQPTFDYQEAAQLP